MSRTERLSVVPDVEWCAWMGNMPKPDGCTYEQMWAMRDAIDKLEKRERVSEDLLFCEKLWKKCLPLYKEAENRKHQSEKDEKKYNAWLTAMKDLKENILTLRNELIE